MKLKNATITGRKALAQHNKKLNNAIEYTIINFKQEYDTDEDDFLSGFDGWSREDVHYELAIDGSSENMIEYLTYISNADDSTYYFYKFPNKTSASIEVYYNDNDIVEFARLITFNRWFTWMQ